MAKLIFVTGTDTGVGKTVITASFLKHLRRSGVHALAVKPFCSGGRDDVWHLLRAQDKELTEGECNPFYFDAPLAPAIAARQQGIQVSIRQIGSHIRRIRRRCDVLLVEGAGGLLVPLGANYTVLDLITELGTDGVIIVSANRLGTVNHTLLTSRVAMDAMSKTTRFEIVLNHPGSTSDASSFSNQELLRRWLPKVPISTMPYLGRNPFGNQALKRGEKKFEKVLARILRSAIFAARQTRRVKKSYKTR